MKNDRYFALAGKRMHAQPRDRGMDPATATGGPIGISTQAFSLKPPQFFVSSVCKRS
jgi:hypothetical protein